MPYSASQTLRGSILNLETGVYFPLTVSSLNKEGDISSQLRSPGRCVATLLMVQSQPRKKDTCVAAFLLADGTSVSVATSSTQAGLGGRRAVSTGREPRTGCGSQHSPRSPVTSADPGLKLNNVCSPLPVHRKNKGCILSVSTRVFLSCTVTDHWVVEYQTWV